MRRKISGYANAPNRQRLSAGTQKYNRAGALQFRRGSELKDTSFKDNLLLNFNTDTPAQAAKKSKRSSANFAVAIRRGKADFFTGFTAILFFFILFCLLVNTVRTSMELPPLSIYRFFNYMSNPPFDIDIGAIQLNLNLPSWLYWLEVIIESLWLAIRFIADCIASTVSFLWSLLSFLFNL